ncbi:MAG: hypothetical protein ACJ77A_07210 [Actinomycetota bacterium]
MSSQEETGREESAGGRGGEREQHPLSRHITVGIVLVSVAITLVGYLQVQASRRSNDAGQEAQRLAALTMSSQLKAQQDAQVHYELFLQAQDQRGRAGNALQESLFAKGDALRAFRVEQQLWQTLADHTQALTPLTANGPDGPQQDASFPRAFFARSTQDALRNQALQDAANTTNSAWEGRAARFTAILTLFAVALYLLGFALALPDRILRLFAGVGVVLLAVGVAWAVQVALSRPSAIPVAAADEYAKGEVALEVANAPDGAKAAVEHFTRAIDEWPGFARAYLGRANATLFGSATQVEAALIPPDALERVESDLTTARDLGFDNGLVLEQLGGTAFSLGLHDRPDQFAAAAAYARQAIQVVPDDPVPRFTLAASLLAQGDGPGSRSAYRDAAARMLYLHGDPSQPRNSPAFEQPYVSGALSDLEAVAAANPALADGVAAAKELVVGSFAAKAPSDPGGDASFSGVRVQLSPGTLAWFTGGSTGFDPSSQPLSAEWYYRPPGAGWVGMPEVSGVIDASSEPSSPGAVGRNLVSSSIPARCLDPGDYRVELYVGGHLAGQGEAPARFGAMRAFIDRSVNLEVCHPQDWRLADSSLPGFRDGLRNADGSQGVYLFRYNLSSLPAEVQRLPEADLTDRLLTETVQQSTGLLPAPVTSRGTAQHNPFQGLAGSTENVYGYSGGFIQGVGGIDPNDKALFVALVFGPRDAFQPSGTSQGVLASVLQSIAEYRFGGSSF